MCCCVSVIFVGFSDEFSPDVDSVILDPHMDSTLFFNISWVTLFPLMTQGRHPTFASLSRVSGKSFLALLMAQLPIPSSQVPAPCPRLSPAPSAPAPGLL